MNAADQIYLLTQKLDRLQRKKRKLAMPVFMAASLDDATVDTQAAVTFVLGQPNRQNRVILYGNARPAIASALFFAFATTISGNFGVRRPVPSRAPSTSWKTAKT